MKFKYFKNGKVEIFTNNKQHSQGLQLGGANHNVKDCWQRVEDYFHVSEKGYGSLQPREVELYFASEDVSG